MKDADIIENKSVSALAVLYISCDNSVFKCSLKRDGIGLVTDHVQHVCDTQNKIVNLCVINSTLFIATSDLVFSYSLEDPWKALISGLELCVFIKVICFLQTQIGIM